MKNIFDEPHVFAVDKIRHEKTYDQKRRLQPAYRLPQMVAGASDSWRSRDTAEVDSNLTPDLHTSLFSPQIGKPAGHSRIVVRKTRAVRLCIEFEGELAFYVLGWKELSVCLIRLAPLLKLVT
jgi:hypothetical protein